MLLRSTHIVARYQWSFFFYGQIVFHWMNVLSFVLSTHLSIGVRCVSRFGLFLIKLLWILLYKYCVNIIFNFSSAIPRSAIAECYRKWIFSLVRNCHPVFQNGWTTLHSHDQYPRGQVAPPSALGIVSLLNRSHSSGWVVASHYSFNAKFSDG